MRKDESGVEGWVKHTRNVYGGRRRVNKGVRRKARVELRGRLAQMVVESSPVSRRSDMVTQIQVKPDTVVQYKGGGYDGCFWEWNYAYIDAEGDFHNIVATGHKGCKTKEELLDYLGYLDTLRIPPKFDLYELGDPKEVERFGRETPISHLLTVGKWLAAQSIDVALTVVCEECEKTVQVVGCEGEGSHGIGGVMMEYDRILCVECFSLGSCCYCGEYVGKDHIDDDTGYCTVENGCEERYGDH